MGGPSWLGFQPRSDVVRCARRCCLIRSRRRGRPGARFTITRASVKSAITVPKPGPTPSMPIVRFAQGTAVSAARSFCIAPARRWTRLIRSTDADRGRLDLWPNECENGVTSGPGRGLIAPFGGTALRGALGLAGANLRSHRPRCSGRIVDPVGLIEDPSIDAADAGCPAIPSSSAGVCRPCGGGLRLASAPPDPLRGDMRSSAGLVRAIGSCRPCS